MKGSVTAWRRDRLLTDVDVATPVMSLWQDYLAYCAEWGFQDEGPDAFVRGLRAVPGAHIVEGGRGRLRRMLSGAYLARETHRRTA